MSTALDLADSLRAAWAADIVRACWQGGLAILIAWTLCALVPRMSPTVRCWIWRLAYVKLLASLVAWPAVEIPILPVDGVRNVAKLAQATDEGNIGGPRIDSAMPADAIPPVVRPSSPRTGASRQAENPKWRPWSSPGMAVWLLFAVWLTGALAAVLWISAQWTAARRLIARATPVSHPTARAAFDELVAELGLTQRVRLLCSTDIRGPALWGVFRPAIVLPPEAIENLRSRELRMLLAHELWHARRRDLLWNWLPAAAGVLFWFHPLVWLAHRHWHFAQESACDEGALAVTAEVPARYGGLLLEVVRYGRLRPQATSVGIGVSASSKLLQRRILAMKSFQPFSRRRRRLVGAALLVAGLAGIVPWRMVAVGAQPPALQAPPPVDNEPDVIDYGEHTIGPRTPRPLAEAVTEFKERSPERWRQILPRQSALPQDSWPAPLTVGEVVAAIRNWHRADPPIPPVTRRIFDRIADTRVLPPHSILEYRDEWRQLGEDDKEEHRMWSIILSAMTGKNRGDELIVRPPQAIDHRLALPVTPGYHWVYGPLPKQEGGRFPSRWNDLDSVSVDNDNPAMLVVYLAGELKPNPTGDNTLHVGEEVNGMRVVAFNAEGKRFNLKGRPVGAGSYYLLRFRLKPAELPPDKVEYLGVERHDDFR